MCELVNWAAPLAAAATKHAVRARAAQPVSKYGAQNLINAQVLFWCFLLRFVYNTKHRMQS